MVLRRREQDRRSGGSQRPGRPAAAGLLLLALLLGGLLLDVVSARPALAHAELASTSPARDARLEEAPAEVTLEFTGAVSVGSGYARVLAAGGERVDTGDPSAGGSTVTIPLRDDVADASYIVTYRVLSADSHPISGAYAFVVGDGELVPAVSGAAGEATDPMVAVALPAARWLGFAGVILAVGVPVLLLTCWPAGWTERRMHRLTSAGLVGLVVGAGLTFLLQGSYAAGQGLSGMVDAELVSSTASSTYGMTLLLRIAAAAALAGVLARVRRRLGPTVPLLVTGGASALAVIVTFAAVGHPVAGPWPPLAVASSAVHVAAMAVWLGGLTALLAGVLRGGTAARDVARVLPVYSRLAFGAVAALVVTGVVQSIREVGTPTALFGTTYGRLLLAKLAVVLLVLAAAGVSRVWVQQHLGHPPRVSRRRVTAHAFAARPDDALVEAAEARTETSTAEVRLLRRSVLVELLLAVAVLGVTAVLVGTPPARATVTEPVDVTLPLDGGAGTAPGSVQVSVSPAATGPNTLHVYYFDESGRLAQPEDIRVTLTEAEQETGPLEVDMVPGGPGHSIGDGMDIPTAGSWTLTVSIRLDEFSVATASTEFVVR